MNKYLVCYYIEEDTKCTDLEKIVEAASIESAISVFKKETVHSCIHSVSRLTDLTSIEWVQDLTKTKS